MQQVIVSVKHKALVVPDVPSISHLFHDAPTVVQRGVPCRVLRHEPAETFLLRKLGYEVPAPILTNYKFTGGYAPFESQRQTCALLTTNERAYNLNDLGTGKTKTILWSYDYLKSNNLVDKMLVTSTKSTVTDVWAREVFETTPHLSCVVLKGTRAQRLELLKQNVNIYIINHDGIKVVAEELFKRKDIQVFAIDELAEFRNPNDRSKLARKLSKQMKFVWGMTGTPLPNSPTDAWMQATIVTPHTVPKYMSHFRAQVMTQQAPHVWTPKPNAEQTAYQALQPAVRFKLSDVTELPECVERFVQVSMGPNQAKVYKSLATTCFAAVQGQKITAINAASVMTKLLQVATGWVYDKEHNVVALDNDLRIEALVDAIKAGRNKTLVFVPFKHALEGIAQALTKEGIDHASVSGDVPDGERDTIFNLFQNTGKYQVLLAHPQCCCHGLTLTRADTAIWFSPIPSLSIYGQANGRIRRVGQKNKQLILKFQSTPIERKIYKILDTKQRFQDNVLDLFALETETNPQK